MTTRKNKSNPFNQVAPRAAIGAIALATAATSLTPATVKADDAAAPSRIHELINLEFATEYVTPRGMIVHDQGVTFQPLALTLVNVYHSDSILNDVTLVGGCWNDFGTAGVSKQPPYGSPGKTMWTEIDPIAGVSLGVTKYFKADITYSAFAEQILSIGTSQNLETKVSFDDTQFLGAFALHPYFSFWDELQGKATDADVPQSVHNLGFFQAPRAGASHPSPGPSYYFELGVDPGYSFKNGIKIEAPLRMTFPNERFYGDYFAKSSVVGIWEVGLKVTVPMNFIPAGYGHWGFHAGYRFMYFVDDNLYQLNTFNAPGPNVRDTSQGYCGVSVFF